MATVPSVQSPENTRETRGCILNASLPSISRGVNYPNDIVPRDPMHGLGPASSYRPANGVGPLMMPPTSTVDEDCPADFSGVLTRYPKPGDGGRTRLQPSFPGVGCGDQVPSLPPRVPVYSWYLPTPTCARTAVPYRGGKSGKLLRFCPVSQRDPSPPYSLPSVAR